MGKECLVCSKLFTPTRKTQIYCSKKCNGKAQKEKLKIKNRERLNSIVRTCKSETCEEEFNPNRNNQVFCSEICADRQGKRDWKKRNHELYKKMERERKKNKYENDPDYRFSRLIKVNTRYHSQSLEEKKERNKKQRLARDPEKVRKYAREYQAERSKIDINFLIIKKLRTSTKKAIKRHGSETDSQTLELIGCSLDHCRNYIEGQFNKNMTWDNWEPKGWHLDHIRPCSSFNMSEESQQYVCFNWRNLRPLWWDENINKKDKYDSVDEEKWEQLMRNLGYSGNLFLLFK